MRRLFTNNMVGGLARKFTREAGAVVPHQACECSFIAREEPDLELAESSSIILALCSIDGPTFSASGVT